MSFHTYVAGFRKRLSVGFTLIELIVAMSIIGIAAVVFLNNARSLFPAGLTPATMTRASHLAQARMELLLSRREQVGYNFNTDPCTANPGATICAGVSGLTVTVSGVASVLSWPVATDTARFRRIVVTVTNSSGTTVAENTAIVANY